MPLLRKAFDPGAALAARPRLDPDAALLQWHYKPDQGLVRLRLRVGLVVLIAAAITATLGRGDGFVLLLAGGFGAVALVNLILGVRQSGFEQVLLITGSEVQVRRRMPLGGRREWREPLSRFRGVALRAEHLPEGTIGNIRSTHTWHIVELVHETPARTVPLFVDDGPLPPRDIQQAFARRFRLPALLAEGARPIAREAVAPRSPTVDPGPAPAGIVVTEEDGGTRIVIGRNRAQRALPALFWLALPLGFGAAVWQLDPFMGAIAAILAAGLALVLVLADLRGRSAADGHPPVIIVDDESIRLDRPSFRRAGFFAWAERLFDRLVGHMPGATAEAVDSLPRAAVTLISVEAYRTFSDVRDEPARARELVRLVIEGPDRRLILALGPTERPKLEWVRDYLQARLATG